MEPQGNTSLDSRQSGKNGVAITAVASVIGGAIGGALGKGLSVETLIMLAAGAAAGAVCGLLPYFVGRGKNRRAALIALWVCVGMGMVGGLILAVPTAAIAAIVVARARPSAATPGATS